MRGELSATAGNLELTVSVEPAEKMWRVRIDDRELLVDAVRVKPGTWSLILDGRSFLIDVDESKQPDCFHTHRAATPILLESAQRKRLAKQMGQGRSAKSKGEVIKAPIAGRVVKMQVELGDVVQAGACVAILEAMKMENEIKALTGGVVSSIDVAAGDSVDTGSKLLSLTPPDAG
jgi:biotin carboxyl carrier protein